MHDFMRYDFSVTNIVLAVFVEPGAGRPVHKDRPSHGLAIQISKEPGRAYVFEGEKVFPVEQYGIAYLPKGSNYVVRSQAQGDCFAINFDIDEPVAFEPFVFRPKNTAFFVNRFRQAANLWYYKKTAYEMQCKAILYEILSEMQLEYALKYVDTDTASIIFPCGIPRP